MKTTKKLLAFFMAAIMIFAVLPVMNAGAGNTLVYNGLSYEILENEVVITSANVSGDYVIPDTIDGYPVTVIQRSAFEGCFDLESIVIPDSVTYIGDMAFYSCESLRYITIGDGVKKIGGLAFHDTMCYRIAASEQPLIYIGKYLVGAHYELSGKYDIKEGTLCIADNAFSGNSSLTEITIPSSVRYIGNNAFHDTGYYNDSNNWDNDVLYVDNCLIEAKTSVSGEYEIKDGTRIIADRAFKDCDLESVVLPESILTIGNEAFYRDSNLKSLNIPDHVTDIGYGAFYGCRGLTGNITIPNTVTVIDESTFDGCSGLKSVTIPNSETSIYSFAFSDCSDDFRIYGCKYSSAETYAKEYNIKFVDINHTHSYSPKVTKKATCTKTGTRTYTCECGESYTEKISALGHSYSTGWTVDKKATCTKAGSKSHHCTRCSAKKDVTSIKATGHTYETTTTKATTSKDGSVTTKCTVCGNVKSKSTISKISSVTLSATSYTYDGNTKTPTVTVKDSKGNKLKSGTDYTFKYSSGRKNVGKYTVTVTFKGKYSGTKKLTFKIVPKGTSVSKLTAGKKQFTVTWKKQSTQTTGYQVQYSTSSKMTNATTKTYADAGKTSLTVKNLKSAKTYFVRVRTYKNVKVDGKTTKYYSSWSSVKSVKTK